MFKEFFDYRNHNSYGFKIRKKRSKIIKNIITKIFLKKKKVFIVDIGGTESFWDTVGINFLKKMNVKITLVNLKKTQIKNKNIFKSIIGDGCKLRFKDKKFDISFSNSVIEHVGDCKMMKKFASEMKRTAKVFYCQTPNFWFPIEPHFLFPFFHFFPDLLKMMIVKNFSIGHYKKAKNDLEALKIIGDAKLITKKKLITFFDKGKVYEEKFCMMTKSLIITNS